MILLLRSLGLALFVVLFPVRAAGLRILTTLPAIHSWAANVAGDDAIVENLLPADVGPHDFQFRQSEMARLAKADLVLANGLGVDDWLGRAIRNNSNRDGGRVVRVTEGLETSLIRESPGIASGGPSAKDSRQGHDHSHEAANPHVWLDTGLARHCVTNILRALSDRDPTNAVRYTRRASNYIRELEALDAEALRIFDGLPDRKVVTFHDAFPYFCRRHGLELVGVIEEVPGAEPSPRYLARLSKAIRAGGARVIFTEPQFNPLLARRLAVDLGVRIAELDVLETGTPSKGFYVEGMRRNFRAVEAALR